ncbi:N-methyltransferase [Aspergillus udagawae]|nr:N-methyltransferase [Aspergillus udagawae]GFF56986.1 N-methyltransferase [Aspergillus udagawae]
MPGIEIRNASGCQVYDIRQQQEDSIDLQAKIRAGLSLTPISLPSLLLWDEEGLRRFDKFAGSGLYYLRDKELEILQKRVLEIAAVIPTGSVLVELGCGSLQKTGLLLQALENQQKAVRYYALDVSLRGLTDSLSELSKELGDLRSVDITGLWGTYDDCVTWISTQLDLEPLNTVTFFWMGNSIGNMDHHSEASALLAQFKDACQASSLRCQFLVAADACEDIHMIQKAYDTSNSTLHAFILNGLIHANAVLGREAFSLEDWSCESEFCPDESQLEVYYTPRRDVQVDVGDGCIYHIKRGQRIRAISSGKWGKSLMVQVGSMAGLRVNYAWGDCSGLYYFYHLKAGAEESGRSWAGAD